MLFRGRQHQLNTVILIDLGCAGVVIDRDDVGVRIVLPDFTHHAFARDMVGQAAERLGAHNVLVYSSSCALRRMS